MVTRDEFIGLLRDGLSRLYDADRLRRNPLTTLLGVADQPDTAAALRSILADGVDSLKPPSGTPSQSRDWRFYEALFYAYVQQLDQRIVADQLGLSVRHLRREQYTAVEVLADALWNRVDHDASRPVSADIKPVRVPGSTGVSAISDELVWLRDLPSEGPIQLKEALTDSLNLVQPLISQHNARVQTDIPDGLPNMAVHPVALNQMLLNLLSVAIAHSADSEVHIAAEDLECAIRLQITGGTAQNDGQEFTSEDETSLELVRQLADVSRSCLSLSEEPVADFTVELVLPALEQVPILAIDDNADTLQLLERYAAGTRYRLVTTRDPREGVELATNSLARVVLLDVMMPQEDGWKVMSMLRQHPQTAHIPVIVCTILAQEKLALSLGASGFLHKPVTRQAFLDALSQLLDPGESSDHSQKAPAPR